MNYGTTFDSELEQHRSRLAALFRKGQVLSDWMGAEGSSGTPTFKQIIMQKQTRNMKEGVRISGMDSKTQNGRKNKGKIPMEPDKTDKTAEVRKVEEQNRANTKDKTVAKLKPLWNEGEQSEEDKEQWRGRPAQTPTKLL